MNYIKHLNHWMELVNMDDRLSAYHISLYLSLFQIWNKSRFPDKIVISRNELFRLSKIGSSKTYYKCLHQLHEFGYICYYPSNNALKGSTVVLVDLSDHSNGELETEEIEPPKSGYDRATQLPKIFYGSQTTTQVAPRQNQHKNCGKSDTSDAQVVTPFKINNINFTNSKHRKRGARETDPDLKNEIKNISKDADEKKRKKSLSSCSMAFSTEASSQESRIKNITARKYVTPTLEQVRAFFISLDTQKLSPRLQNQKDLELEALKFFHHYQANGWLVGGKSPVRNWLSAGLSWMAKAPYFNRKFNSPGKANPLHVDNDQQFGKPL